MKRKPKVLFLLQLPPPVYGATVVNEYIRKSCIINEGFECHFVDLATNRKLQEVKKASFRKLFSLIKICFRVVWNLLGNKYSLCLVSLTASGPAFYKDLIIVGILKIFSVRIVYFFHNKGVEDASVTKINRYLYKFVFSNTRCILVSKFLYPDIKRYVRETDVFYCPLGIPLLDTQGKKRDARRFVTPCRLLYLGNMMHQKGVFVLLEACKILKEQGCCFHCRFVGGWADISAVDFNDYVIKNDLADVATAGGPLFNQEKARAFEESDIFVFPTFYHYETFGLVNLEAMQYGLPIISTFEGGIPDVVLDGQTGFLVPQRDPKALADKLKILIDNEELRKKMGQSGEERYHEIFTVEKFESNMAMILREAIQHQ